MINRRRSLGNKFIPKPYLKFTALEDGTFKHNTDDLEYSLNDGKTWTALPANTDTPTIHTGESICWRGTMNPGNKNQCFSSTGKFDASGNPLSLKYKNNFVNATVVNYQYYRLFYGCTNIINAKDLSIADDFGNAISVCMRMFEGCTSLLTAPELPATNLGGNGCYHNMFYGCSSLISAPSLPATTVKSNSYNAMFYNCTSLTTAPALPATTVATSCYQSMFVNCTSLVNVPDLPATTLAPSCYYFMFSGCTSLTSTPVMSPTTLASQCCQRMFADCRNLQNVLLTLPATTVIDRCYYGMFSNTKIASIPTLPSVANNTTNSYGSMFNSCTQLTTVQLPEFMNVLPEGMFNRCSNLESIYIPSTITDSLSSAFGNCTKLKTVNISNLNNYLNITYANATACPTYNGADLYLNGVKVTDVTLSQAKDYVLYNCKSIETVNWSGTITSIGASAFCGCSNLSNITIPNTVASIGSSAFRGTKITSIDIPEGITILNSTTFSDCAQLVQITIPTTLTQVDSNCFYGINTSCIVNISDLDAWCRINFNSESNVSTSPTSRAKHLYLNGTEVTSVTVPNDVTRIRLNFVNLVNLSSVVLQEGLIEIGYQTFAGCTSLTQINIPSTVTTIGPQSFNGSRICSITLPSGITNIGGSAFAYNGSLTEIIIQATTPPTLGTNVLSNSNNAIIYVPDANVTDYKTASVWSTYASRIKGLSKLPE